MGKIKYLENKSETPVVLCKSVDSGPSGVINRGGFAFQNETRKFNTAVTLPKESGRHLFLMTAQAGYQIYRTAFDNKKAKVFFVRLSGGQEVKEVERGARYRLRISTSGDPELIQDQETSG